MLALDALPTVVDAVRLRDVLCSLLVGDVVRHASRANLVGMRKELTWARHAAKDLGGIAFTHANWALHACIAQTSPNVLIRSFYVSLLEIIESPTMSVQVLDEQRLSAYIYSRYRLHADLVTLIAGRDTALAAGLIDARSTPNSTPAFDPEQLEPVATS